MFWTWAILGVIAYLLIVGSMVMFIAAASRARKRCERLWLESRGAVPPRNGKAA